MTARHRLLRSAAYLWAAPTTAVGLLAGALTLATGGGCDLVGGVLEFRGGFALWMLRLPFVRAAAMTLGHVILGRDRALLASCRAHEWAHVRQVERWGPFFLPAYIGASLYVGVMGGRIYEDNPFERQARIECGEEG